MESRSFGQTGLQVSARSASRVISASIAGTIKLEHLRQNVEWVERGPLDEALVEQLRRRYEEANQG